MSVRVGDAVLVHINDESRSQRIGVLEYIGYIDSNNRSKIVGINLIESVENGHNGSINGIQHFKAIDGHGIYVRIQNIITKLDCRQLTLKIQQITLLFKERLNQYITALTERDEYIEELKNSKRQLKKLLNKSKNQTSSNNNSLHTITEFMTAPPPISKLKSDESTDVNNKKVNTKRNKNRSKERSKRNKRCEYTKYSDRHKNVEAQTRKKSQPDIELYYTTEECDMDSKEETSSSSSSSSGDEYENENEMDSTDDDLAWCDDASYRSSNTNNKYEAPTPISISTQSRSRKQNSILSNKSNKSNKSRRNDRTKKNNKLQQRQKSHSTHNTPHQSPIVNNLNNNNMRRIELMAKSISPQNQYHHMKPQIIHHQKSFSNQSPQTHAQYHNDRAMYYTNPQQNMQHLYDMMMSQQQQQQQNIIHAMQPIQRTQTVPTMPHMTQTKRRSLHKIQPIPELRDNKGAAKKKLKLTNRRSNSVDGHYFSEVQLKDQVINLQNRQQHIDHSKHNGNHNVNYNGHHQYVFQTPQPHMYQHNSNSPPSDHIITVNQPLIDHFSAYF